MPKSLPFENVDFAGMARNINDPGQPAPLPKERSTIAHDVMELAKTGIETVGKVKEKQIDDRRKAQINTITAISAASAIAGRGLRVSPGMFGDALTLQQTDEINKAAEEQKKIQSQRTASPKTYAPSIKQVGNEVYEYEPNKPEGERWTLLHTLPPEEKGIKYKFLGGGGIRIREGSDIAEKFNPVTGKYEPYSKSSNTPIAKPGQTGPVEGEEKIENGVRFVVYNGQWIKAEE